MRFGYDFNTIDVFEEKNILLHIRNTISILEEKLEEKNIFLHIWNMISILEEKLGETILF